MAKKQIIVTISPKGEVKIEGKGFNGRDCLRATEPFEKILGKATSKKMKLQREISKERQSLGN